MRVAVSTRPVGSPSRGGFSMRSGSSRTFPVSVRSRSHVPRSPTSAAASCGRKSRSGASDGRRGDPRGARRARPASGQRRPVSRRMRHRSERTRPDSSSVRQARMPLPTSSSTRPPPTSYPAALADATHDATNGVVGRGRRDGSSVRAGWTTDHHRRVSDSWSPRRAADARVSAIHASTVPSQNGTRSAQISICVPSSTTWSAGRPKNEAAFVALRLITVNRRLRHAASPESPTGTIRTWLRK